MQLELKQLQRELEITFIYVTHDQEEALTMSDRIVVMNKGRIEQVGTAHEIYERPQTKFVAQFIGETNLFEDVEILEKNGNDYVVAIGSEKVSTDSMKDFKPGEKVHISIRPENMKLSRTPMERKREHCCYL